MTARHLQTESGDDLPAADHDLVPAVPATLEATGLSEEFIVDLLLKTLYVQGARSGQQLVEGICLPFPIVDEHLLTLQQRRIIEVRGTCQFPSRGGYIFDLTASGRERAREATISNQYVGPAPVPLEHYRTWVQRQSIQHMHVTRETVEKGFSGLVLTPGMTDQLGPAVNSAKSLFLYGESGNGKTAIAEIIARLLGGPLFVPYAIENDGQVIVVYDPVYHRKIEEERFGEPGRADLEALWSASRGAYDQRFVKVERPVVLTGGELTLDQLELQFDNHTKMYQAPFQMKANGGVLIVDDFGRQRVPPRDLLNRWIVPLEKRVDFLTLHTGSKFPVPFDCLLIFATNIDPKDLVEEAFLRRIHYKIEIGSPTREQYLTIFQRYCQLAGIPFTRKAVDYVYTNFYERYSIAPRGCHPRDIIDHVKDIAKFMEEDPLLSPELMDRACRSYFLDFPTPGGV
ncbi:MAG: ATP-binding protein [Gemmatimonadales bacterium]